MSEHSTHRKLGEGIPVDAIGADRWTTEGPWRGWRRLSEEDRIDFEQKPSAKYLVREYEPADVVPEACHHWYTGARQLVVVFRSGHQLARDCPGWLELDRAIEAAESALALCPALGAAAIPDDTPRIYGRAEFGCDDPRCISPLVSGFVYVDAPGGMTIGHYGARIYKDFDPTSMTPSSRLTVGFYQRMVDTRRRFDRWRMNNYTAPLHFPKEIVAAKRPRIRLL